MSRRKELTESDMEDAIVADPEKFLGEPGLKLVARQYRVGPYIFDLLFEDRHGTKLIVELQLGTLDRNHTYKILDYYEEYKMRRPNEFIELILVANRFTYERRQRLNACGVNWREIPEEKFVATNWPTREAPESKIAIDKLENNSSSFSKTPSNAKAKKAIRSSGSYSLFQKQTELFFVALKDIQPPIRITVRPDNSENWFTGFAPVSWGRKMSRSSSGAGSGYGSGVLGYAFNYTTNNNGDPYVRLHIGVENPFKKEFRDNFKKEVSIEVATQNIILPQGCRIWPNSKFPDFRFHGTSLIECQPIALNDKIWEIVSNNYVVLNKEYNALIAKLLRTYYEQGAFNVDIDFKY